jgi:hypothetical protein
MAVADSPLTWVVVSFASCVVLSPDSALADSPRSCVEVSVAHCVLVRAET